METKRIFRSRKDRILGGVCGGVGNYLNIDPVIVRVIWAVSLFIFGTGFLAYILGWILIPEEPIGA
jgi:phage shock protein PspC (stress-responsive transcriptional regulator)